MCAAIARRRLGVGVPRGRYVAHSVAGILGEGADRDSPTQHTCVVAWAGNLNDVAWGVTMAPASAIVVGYFQSERFTMRYPVNGTRRPANSSAYTPLRNIAFNESTYEELDNLGDLSLDIFIAAIDYQGASITRQATRASVATPWAT